MRAGFVAGHVGRLRDAAHARPEGGRSKHPCDGVKQGGVRGTLREISAGGLRVSTVRALSEGLLASHGRGDFHFPAAVSLLVFACFVRGTFSPATLCHVLFEALNFCVCVLCVVLCVFCVFLCVLVCLCV